MSAEHGEAVAPTQDALYRDLDLDLSWSERDLPERERTKHVHRLHPYLGKFIPQLVEALLGRYFAPGQHVLDPFAGSGTTLVQALESGLDATGADIAAFNCLLMEVKTRRYNPFVLERELRAACERIGETSTERPRGYLRAWFAPQAARELLGFRGLVDDYVNADVLRVALGRAARSGSPTIANAGSPFWRCASTSTRRASRPTSAWVIVRASTPPTLAARVLRVCHAFVPEVNRQTITSSKYSPARRPVRRFTWRRCRRSSRKLARSRIFGYSSRRSLTTITTGESGRSERRTFRRVATIPSEYASSAARDVPAAPAPTSSSRQSSSRSSS